MFTWIFSKLFPQKIQTPTNQANNKHTVMLHGFDLSAWDYLGYTTLLFNVKGKKEYPSNCFFFVNKKILKRNSITFRVAVHTFERCSMPNMYGFTR